MRARQLRFSKIDANNGYNRHIARLEELRALTGRQERDFYLGLLHTPLAEREETVIGWIIQQSGQSRDTVLERTRGQRAFL